MEALYMASDVSKRYFITLPDGIGEALEKWAESERNKPSTLAAFLVESAIRQAIADGIVPPPHELKTSSESSENNQ